MTGGPGGSPDPTGGYIYADYGAEPDPTHRPLYLHHVLEFLRPLPSGAAVFDAGCGGGDFAIGLDEAGYEVFGGDLSPSAIEHARTLGIGRFERASLYENLGAPFGRKSFDAIVCIDVIEHLYSPQSFVDQAAAALPADGLMVVTTPYWGYAKNVVLALTNRIDRSLTALWEGGHIKHFSRSTLGELMQRNGFEEVAFRGAGEGIRAYLPYLWSGMAVAYRRKG